MAARRLLTVDEVAEMFALKRDRIYDAARAHLIPVVRIGRQVRFDEAQLLEWLRQGGRAWPGGWKKEA